LDEVSEYSIEESMGGGEVGSVIASASADLAGSACLVFCKKGHLIV